MQYFLLQCEAEAASSLEYEQGELEAGEEAEVVDVEVEEDGERQSKVHGGDQWKCTNYPTELFR